MTSWITAIGRMLGSGTPQTAWAWDERRAVYDANDLYYANRIYERTASGGQRDVINADLGNAAAADLSGLYNPIAQVVDLYLHVFSGAFGDEIQIEPTGGEPSTADAPTATDPLTAAIARIWQWSNLTVEKQPLCRLAATHGCVGLRIVARDDADVGKRRVYLKPEHPRTIRDARLDDRGNVGAIQLEYDLTCGLAEDAEVITIREELTKLRIRTWQVDGARLIPFDLGTFSADGMPVDRLAAYACTPVTEPGGFTGADYPNTLGVVPYVILRHEHTGDPWGRSAWYKARAPIDRLNSLICHTDIQVHRHVNGVLFVAASGPAPTEMVLSGNKVAYVDTRGATIPPFMQWMVADLDLAGALGQAQLQIGLIEDMLPELKATAGKFLSNQSGETIAALRKPAEDAVLLARSNYEDGLVRAQKIGVSWMILLELADLGTGSGTRDAADAAFQGGFEDHRFNTRPALGETVAALPQQAPTPAAPEVVNAPPENAAPAQNGRAPVGGQS